MGEDQTFTADMPRLEPARPDPPRDWRERLEVLRSRWTMAQMLGAALLGLGVLAAALVVMRPGTHQPTEQGLPMASSSSTSAGSSSGQQVSSTAPAQVVVHAAGAFVAPGVYRLATGSRIADLVAAAGGLAADADPDRVNLAALLHDGERIAVPRLGEASPVPGDAPAASDGAPKEPLDLNAATEAQLEALPGVGPSTAKAIVDDRERNGSYRSVDELLRVRGIGPAKLEQIRALVSV
ncbi:MAG: ComEA family DNA-binding protein [Acidimicrobiales bacterium]